MMRPASDDRLVGALALAEPSTCLAITPDGGERKLGLADVPVGKRGGRGQKVVKRGGVAAIRRGEGEGMAASYTAKDILVLEGLEPGRRRPGMDIGRGGAAGARHPLVGVGRN